VPKVSLRFPRYSALPAADRIEIVEQVAEVPFNEDEMQDIGTNYSGCAVGPVVWEH